MKNKFNLLIATAIAAGGAAYAAPAAAPDFAPMTMWDTATNTEIPAQDNGVGIAWQVKDPDEKLDYKLMQTDSDAGAAEAQRVVSKYEEAGKLQNILYNVKTNAIIAVMTKDATDSTAKYHTCYEATRTNSNHADCTVRYNPSNGFALFEMQGSWRTLELQALQLKNSAPQGQTPDLQADAQSNLTSEVNARFAKAIDRKYASNEDYKKESNAKLLEYTYDLKTTQAAGPDALDVTGVGNAEQPKGMGKFAGSITAKVKLVRSGNKIVIK